jgi:hypothetical protein
LFCNGGAKPVKGGTSLFRPLTGLAPVQGCSYDRPSAEENQNNRFPLVRFRDSQDKNNLVNDFVDKNYSG